MHIVLKRILCSLPYWLTGLPDEHLSSQKIPEKLFRENPRKIPETRPLTAGQSPPCLPQPLKACASPCYANLHRQANWASVKMTPIHYEVLIVIAIFAGKSLPPYGIVPCVLYDGGLARTTGGW
jgi:hypothetical protein